MKTAKRNRMERNNEFRVHIHAVDLESIEENTLSGIFSSIRLAVQPGKIADPGPLYLREMKFTRDIVAAVLREEKQPVRCEINLVFTSNNYIKEMNLRYLSRESETDVLCFPYSSKPPFKCDIVISVEKAYKQSKEYRNTFSQELAVLVIHGLLHLLGWNDDSEKSMLRMHRRQDELLKITGIK